MTPAARIGWGIAAALALVSCSAERSAGGTVETENLTAIVVSVDSIVPVSMREGALPVVATVRLDSLNFDFDRAGPMGEHLVVERLDGSPLPFAIRRWEAVEKWARVQIRVEGDLLHKGSRLRLRADALQAWKSDSTTVWAWIPSDLRTRWTSVLVDDFEHGDTRTLLPLRSAWYTKQADSASISAPALVPASGGRTGAAMRFDYAAKPPSPGYVLLGATLASRPVNFASLDSIVFWAKGSGVLSVSLDHQIPGSSTTKAWMHDDLDSTWTRWRVRPQDFDPAAASGGVVGWASVHDSVTTLSIFASGRGTVMLDDIRFYGMQEDDFR